jgi:hypothetical protein
VMAPSCPSCGSELTAVALDGDTPPWLCTICSRGWWDSGLANSSSYDPLRHDWGNQTQKVLAAIDQEHKAATVRGTGASEQSAQFLPLEVLKGLASQPLDKAFAAKVQAELRRRGGK